MNLKTLAAGLLAMIGLSTALLSAPAGAQQPPQVIQRIEALVNDQVITAYDVGQRMGLVLLATGQTITNEQQLEQLRQQVLESLIDETLEIQEAKRYEVPAPEGEIEAAYQRVARSYNRTPETFPELLQQYGTSKEAILKQIRAEYMWQTLVNGRYGSQSFATDEEVDEYLANLKANEGKMEYRISEIFFSVPDPTVDEIIAQRVNQIRSQMQGFQQFPLFARQFSQSTSAAQGGDVGWVTGTQLDPAVHRAVQELDIFEVSDPIKTSGGYYIIALTDRRRILSTEPMDELLNLTQITFRFTRDTTQEQVETWGQAAEERLESYSSCDNIPSLVEDLGGNTVLQDHGEIALKQLNPELRKILMPLQPGQHTGILNTPEGLVIFFVCGRRMPEATPPTREQVEQQLTQERVSMMARRYLRDLRRDAIIEYK